METKIILLTTNQIIISQITEVPAAIPGEPDCKLSNPFTIKDNDILEPFLLKVTKDDTFMISSDKILTLADPHQHYLKNIKTLLNEVLY